MGTATHSMKLPVGPINVALKPFHILISKLHAILHSFLFLLKGLILTRSSYILRKLRFFKCYIK